LRQFGRIDMTTATQTTGTQDEGKVDDNPLSTLVGEGKKFKTVDDLARGKQESDKFIEKVTSENKELRELIANMSDKVSNLEKKQNLLANLNSNDDEHSNDDSTTSTTSTSASATNHVPKGLGEDDVLRLVERREVEKTQENNVRAVNAALVKEFGAEAQNVVLAKAAELSLPVEYLFNMAKASPNAFFAAIGFNPNPSRNATMTSRIQGTNSTSNTNASKATLRNNAYYQGLKKEMGATKFVLNRELQVQMHKDMMELGDLFD
jgi:flagellar capping protein FliD